MCNSGNFDRNEVFLNSIFAAKESTEKKKIHFEYCMRIEEIKINNKYRSIFIETITYYILKLHSIIFFFDYIMNMMIRTTFLGIYILRVRVYNERSRERKKDRVEKERKIEIIERKREGEKERERKKEKILEIEKSG